MAKYKNSNIRCKIYFHLCSYSKFTSDFLIIFYIARYKRIATASLITPSPNIIELRFLYLSAVIRVRTATVSVEQRTEASKMHSEVKIY